jgi:hypothetical protein
MPAQDWAGRGVHDTLLGAIEFSSGGPSRWPDNRAARSRYRNRGQDGCPMTSRECREQAAHFAALSLEGGNSVRRATILMAIADSWTRLAGQLDRLEALETDERLRQAAKDALKKPSP